MYSDKIKIYMYLLYIKSKKIINKIKLIFSLVLFLSEKVKCILSLRGGEEIYSLTKLENGYKVYHTLKSQTLLYDENGLLLYVIDRNGNKREYVYENTILKRINFMTRV